MVFDSQYILYSARQSPITSEHCLPTGTITETLDAHPTILLGQLFLGDEG